jgi:hypothetical protein
MDPVLGGVVAEREQDVKVIGDLRGGLGSLDARAAASANLWVSLDAKANS